MKILSLRFKNINSLQDEWKIDFTQSPFVENGLFAIIGPTGSGKTTTLYSTLKQLAKPEVNVCTVEDPIELVEPSINQMQVQKNIDAMVTHVFPMSKAGEAFDVQVSKQCGKIYLYPQK